MPVLEVPGVAGGDDYYDLLAQKVQEKWDNGSYRKAQGELPPDPEATSGYYITQIAHNGWLASVHVGDETRGPSWKRSTSASGISSGIGTGR